MLALRLSVSLPRYLSVPLPKTTNHFPVQSGTPHAPRPTTNQAQNLVMPVMKVTLLGVLANVAFHHLTMVVLGMGVYGAGLALSLTGMFLLVTMVAYTWVFRCVGNVCTHWVLSVCVSFNPCVEEYMEVRFRCVGDVRTRGCCLCVSS